MSTDVQAKEGGPGKYRVGETKRLSAIPRKDAWAELHIGRAGFAAVATL
jgi:hypothetical protein